MYIQQKNFDDEEHQGQYATLIIEVDGIEEFQLGGGESKNMTLGRDLSCAYDVILLMQRAFNAGKNGEKFIVLDDIKLEEY